MAPEPFFEVTRFIFLKYLIPGPPINNGSELELNNQPSPIIENLLEARNVPPKFNVNLGLNSEIINIFDNKRINLSNKYYAKRKKLKDIIMDKKLPLEERFKAQQKLSKLPRNSSKTRVMNRCQITGRPHGVYRKLKISRIALRQLGLEGKIPGMVKSSW